ncbi:MAG: hypothetical protein HC935_02645 [Pseudanabaena sp. SU_2_4]|nr:hypothetical protein [Pseudanabaena sp. SU_2_4]
MKNIIQWIVIAVALVGMLIGAVSQHAAIPSFCGVVGLVISHKRLEDRLQALQQSFADRAPESQVQMPAQQQKMRITFGEKPFLHLSCRCLAIAANS